MARLPPFKVESSILNILQRDQVPWFGSYESPSNDRASGLIIDSFSEHANFRSLPKSSHEKLTPVSLQR